jgi:hypothetical protein
MGPALNIILNIILLNITNLLNNYSETQLSEQVMLYEFQGHWLFNCLRKPVAMET